MAGESEILRKWLRDGLKKPGKRQLELAKKLGYQNNSPVAKMIAGRQQIRADQLPTIAAYIEEIVPSQFRVDRSAKSEEGMFLVGRIDSASWRDISMVEPAVRTDISKYVEGAYAFVKQEAYKVVDDSADAFAARGEYVIAVDYEAVGLDPEHDDIVIVILRQAVAGNDGAPRELSNVTMRKVEKRGSKLVLLSLSPLHPGFISYNPERMTLRYVVGKALYRARQPRT
jgi:hypothetical protein